MPTVYPPLTPGDRAYNFALRDQEGTLRLFYAEVTGGPIVLHVCRALDGDNLAALRALARATPDFTRRGAQIFLVAAAAADTARRVAVEMALDFPLFADPSAEIVDQFLPAHALAFPGAAPARPARASFVLDPNQRVLAAVVDGAAGAHAEACLAALDDFNARAATEALVLAATAPVLMLPDVFDAAMCARLVELWRQGGHEEGGVSGGADNARDAGTKRTLDHVVREPALNQEISAILTRRVGPELVKVFNHAAPLKLEGAVIMAYSAEREDFFAIHRDNLRPESARRFAISINLNDGFEGGALRFPEYGPHLYRPPAGGAVVFSGHLLHEALPVTRGQRFMVTNFFCDRG